MDFVNSIQLTGTLLELPNMKSFPSGTTLGTFKIKNIRTYTKKDGTEVIEDTIVEFQTWNKRIMEGFGLWYVGMNLAVEGRLKGSSWVKEGKTINKINFLAEFVEVEEEQKKIVDAPPVIKPVAKPDLKIVSHEIDLDLFEELPF